MQIIATASETITDTQVEAYRRDGAVVIPRLFRDWVSTLSDGIERNMREPGPHTAENLKPGEQGRFFDGYCNWTRIPEFKIFVRESPAAGSAARLMRSKRVQMFHDHVLAKEPGTSKPTPWHQDAPYYFVEGDQTLSFWVPVDPVTEASLRVVAGSHRWEKPVLPTRWLSEEKFYQSADDYLPVPDPDSEPGRYTVLEWPTQPATPSPFITNRSTAQGETRPRHAAGRFPCASSVTTHATSNAPSAPRRPFRATACNRARSCARTGSRLSGRGNPHGPRRIVSCSKIRSCSRACRCCGHCSANDCVLGSGSTNCFSG